MGTGEPDLRNRVAFPGGPQVKDVGSHAAEVVAQFGGDGRRYSQANFTAKSSATAINIGEHSRQRPAITLIST